MSPKKAITIIVPSIAIIIALFFIPTSDFIGTGSSEESPSPIMVLENSEDVLKGLNIIPISCNETDSGLTEFRFQITNTHENDYEVRIGVSFTDNDAVLYETEEIVEIFSGETINQIHLSDNIYDNPVCVVQINEWKEL